MSRELYVDIEIVDLLSVYEPDEVTKRSGLTAANFTVTAYLDGSSVSLGETIVEVGSSGDYALRFTPTATGFYYVEVSNDYDGVPWIGEYDVVSPVLLGVV